MTKVAPIIRSVSDHFRTDLVPQGPESGEFETIDLDDAPQTQDESSPEKYTYASDSTLSSSIRPTYGGKGDEPREEETERKWKLDKDILRKKLHYIGTHWCTVVFVVLGPLILFLSGGIMRSVCQKISMEHTSKLPTLCFITNIEEVNYTAVCECGECEGRSTWTCFSTYPCYIVNVDYASSYGVNGGAGKIGGQNVSTPCSVDLPVPCHMKEIVNRKLVEEEISWLQEQDSGVDCVLDLEAPDVLPLRKNYKLTTNAAVSRCYFWPVMLILLVLAWFSFVLFDGVNTYRNLRKKRLAIKILGKDHPCLGDSLYRGVDMSAWLRSNTDLSRWQRFKTALKNQFMDKEPPITKKRLEFIESMRNRTRYDVFGNVEGTARPDTFLQRSSHLINVIGKETFDRDAEGTAQKQELANMIKFLRTEPVPMTESESESEESGETRTSHTSSSLKSSDYENSS